jgi:glycosyltransferase involved in cell wall biosynthesis
VAKVSVIIPARNEPYLQQTVNEVFSKAVGDVETIVVLDGQENNPYPIKLPRNLLVIQFFQPQGMRSSINAGAEAATGKYLMKLDAHCALSEGYDEILQAGLDDDWVVVPRFYTLNAEEWKWQDGRFCDYYYLSCPMTDRKQFRFSTGGYWWERTQERLDIFVDDAMIFHGSCWMMSAEHFWRIGPLDNAYGTHGMEPQEICFKTWLGPWNGRVMVNKRAWNAHMHKGRQRPRGYHMGKTETFNSYDYCARYWMANSWPQQAKPLEWLIDKFSPVPTWPENWRELYEEWKAKDVQRDA